MITDAICLQNYKEYINKTNLRSRAVARFWYIIADYQKIKGSCDTLFATNFLQHQISLWSDFVMFFFVTIQTILDGESCNGASGALPLRPG